MEGKENGFKILAKKTKKKECKEANASTQEMRRNAAQLWARTIGQNIQSLCPIKVPE